MSQIQPLPTNWHNPSAECNDELTEEDIEKCIDEIKDNDILQFGN